MEAVFHGAAVITLDAKGRVAVPTRHRSALGKPLVLTAHPDGCVLMYPIAEWEPVRTKVAAFPSFDAKAKRAELDAAGADVQRALMAYIPRVTAGARYTRLSDTSSGEATTSISR